MNTGDSFNLDQFKATYFEECSDLLAAAEDRLSAIQANPYDIDTDDLHAIFRAIHSIKGGAGAFDFTQLVGFAHVYETLLDSMREGLVAVTEEAIAQLFAANDVLANLVQAAQDGVELPEDDITSVAAELEALNSGADANADDGDDDDSDGDAILSDDTPEEDGWGLFDDGDAADQDGPRLYQIEFSPKPELLHNANEPLLLIRELQSLGELTTKLDSNRLPPIGDLQVDNAYFQWVFHLNTEADEDRIREVFEFVEDDCDLVIKTVSVSSTGEEEKADAAPQQGKDISVGSNAGLSAKGGASEPAAPPQPAPGAAKTTGGTKISSIRVDLDRVDRLVNMVGELVITQAMLRQQTLELPTHYAQIMNQGFEDLTMHTRELQESVMAIRMQPVKSVFSRMPRLVRELSAKLGKKVDLVTDGENTEVDKTVVELLADPLTHMIRNSLDHGIETTEERAKTDKPERATVFLSAEHRSGRILIDIADDGRGINREKVLQKAVQRGIVAADANLSPDQIDDLIFMPGFSTADAVTDVSGRGVGMDVVRKNVSNLGGRISVTSVPGKGTKFTMSLPLTLAVLDGMVIAVGAEKYVIPLTAIVETIRPQRKEINTLSNGTKVVSMRGDYIRLIFLHSLFGIPDAKTDPCEALVVIVEAEGGENVGIVVDELLGQQQVVIKSLEANYDPVQGISAATILGNGRVALILDIDGLGKVNRPPASPDAADLPKQLETVE